MDFHWCSIIFRSVGVGFLLQCVISFAAVDSSESLLEKAYALDSGESGARDPAAAATYYEEAAAAGDPFAQLRLGYFYEVGDGVDHNYDLARQLYQSATDSGLAEARLRLAICHLEGWGGPVDREAFVDELTLAADADYVPAQRVIAQLYFLGFYVEEDRSAGLRWLERAALLDDAAAQFDLGQASEGLRSLSVESDRELSRRWYELSAEQEYLESMRALSRSFLSGSPNDHDWTMARAWLELADEAGDDEAPCTLAFYSLLHPAQFTDATEDARSLLERAATRGNRRAQDILNIAAAENQTLKEAYRYVLNTPHDDRYVENVARNFREHTDPSNRPAQVIRIVHPIFPFALRMVSEEGKALISFEVDVTGRVSQTTVVSATHPLFGQNAAEAVERWRFLPAVKNGKLVKSHMQIPIALQRQAESIKGVDGFLGMVQDRAFKLGEQAWEDAQNIRPAEPIERLPDPRMPDGQPPPENSQVLILLYLDKTGTPLRGHILESKPKELGPTILESALRHRFKPRRIGEEPVAGSVVLPMHWRRPNSEG